MDSDYTNIQAQIETFNMSPEQENFSLAVLETCKKKRKNKPNSPFSKKHQKSATLLACTDYADFICTQVHNFYNI